MDCSGAQAKVHQYIQHTLQPQEEEDFLNHVENCQACRDELETNFIVHAALDSLDTGSTENLDFRPLLEQELKRSRHRILLWRIKKTLMILLMLVGAVGGAVLLFLAVRAIFF